MFVRMILAFCAILLPVLAAAAQDCQKLESDAREALIRKTPNCN